MRSINSAHKIGLIIILLMSFITSEARAQNTKLVGKIEHFSVTETTLVIGISITSNSAGNLVFKPTMDAVMYGLLNVYLKDNSGRIYDIYPFDTEFDLDTIYLDFDNSICLNANESFSNTLKIQKRAVNLPPANKDYQLILKLSYKDENLKLKYPDVKCEIFNERISMERKVSL